jgi:hypothetical protein
MEAVLSSETSEIGYDTGLHSPVNNNLRNYSDICLLAMQVGMKFIAHQVRKGSGNIQTYQHLINISFLVTRA